MEIRTPGALKSGFLGAGSDLCYPGDRLENSWIFGGGTDPRRQPNYLLSGALDAFQTVTTDLHPAASGPMTVEKQTTLTNGC